MPGLDVCRPRPGRTDSIARANIVNTSQKIQTGEMRRPGQTISSILQGAAFLASPLGQPWQVDSCQPKQIVIPLQVGADDIEMLNVLGVARGNRGKESCFYAAISSLPAAMRFNHQYMCVAQVYAPCTTYVTGHVAGHVRP